MPIGCSSELFIVRTISDSCALLVHEEIKLHTKAVNNVSATFKTSLHRAFADVIDIIFIMQHFKKRQTFLTSNLNNIATPQSTLER
ncbi:hypothetical protein Bra5_PD00320 (plasmid) [Rhizobium phaseoli Brasil 5]|nr:hypothetical protein Bra5_PD00320 [Rhizobium phaseoli Brasil 5]